MTDFAVPIGATIPLKFHLTSDVVNGGLDLTTVTSVTLVASRPDGTTAPNWTASLIPEVGQAAVTPTLAIILYATQATDLLIKGIWRVEVLLNNSGGVTPWPGAPMSFRVTDPWGRP